MNRAADIILFSGVTFFLVAAGVAMLAVAASLLGVTL